MFSNRFTHTTFIRKAQKHKHKVKMAKIMIVFQHVSYLSMVGQTAHAIFSITVYGLARFLYFKRISIRRLSYSCLCKLSCEWSILTTTKKWPNCPSTLQESFCCVQSKQSRHLFRNDRCSFRLGWFFLLLPLTVFRIKVFILFITTDVSILKHITL